MIFKIKNIAGDTLFKARCASLPNCIEKAVKSGISLADANFRNANLMQLYDHGRFRQMNLAVADLRRATFEGANVEGACFRYADLMGANFNCAKAAHADFRGAALAFATFNDAFLEGAIFQETVTFSDRFITVGQIGSHRRQTLYDREQDVVWCGCFRGTLKQFEAACEETHKNNKRYLAEYRAAISFIKAVDKARG